MNVAVLHDGTIHPGGAVNVVIEAAKVLDADLYVGFSGPDPDWWADRVPGEVEVLARRKKGSVLRDAATAWRFRQLDLSEYDVVLSSGPATKFYRPSDNQRIYHYLHHPPLPALWFHGSPVAYVIKVIDRIETGSIPTVIANSEVTASRIEAHYNRTPERVINPPVNVDRFSPDREKRPNEVVMVGRLEGRKRPTVAVDAFRRLARDDDPPQLHLVGDGPLRSKLERNAPANVHFHGYVDDDRLVELVERAGAGLFLAKREDFGIVPIEYMAAGTPVVGVDEPNTNNQIANGETGLLVEPTPEAVTAGVKRALSRSWSRDSLRRAAEAYGVGRFHTQIKETVR